jgi:hypothetical protein
LQVTLPSRHFIVIVLALLGANCLYSQSTNIAIGSTVLQPSVKRMGINLGTLTNYDSGQMYQNLITSNPGFEGQIWNSTIRCAYGTATSCTDENQWSSWPAGFWSGASYQFFYGKAAGRSGTVTSSSAPGYGAGVILNFGDSGVTPAQGDYVIVRRKVPGGSTGGWYPYNSGNGFISDNLTDLPPGTLGLQTTALTAPTSADYATLSAYFDSTAGISFIQLNGNYQLQFKAKGTGGSRLVSVRVTRYGGATYISQNVALSSSWNTYNLTFTAAESGSAVGTVGVSFSTSGADSFELDDVSLTQTGTDPTNTTVFRDGVVNALRTLQPGVLRYWGGNGQLGDTLDNLLTPSLGRQRAGFSAWSSQSNQIDYGLHEFLQLCQLIGAEPWFVVPSTFTTTDTANLIDYLAGSTATIYGAKRAALGQATSWSQVFSKIHLEFGNEEWNSTFSGGSILYAAPYSGRAQTMFGIMRAMPDYVPSAFDLIVSGQAANPGLTSSIQNGINNNDSFAIAAYTMTQVNSFSTNELLFGSTFAEPEALMSSASSTSAEGLSPGYVYENYQSLQMSSHPVPMAFYEANLSTLGGTITQAALNSYTSSLGAGLMVADTMLQGLRSFGVINQELFALPQYDYTRSDGSNVFLWGSVVDMGNTNRKRPQFLALQLANQALSNGASEVQTVHSGADPTWNEALTNSVQMTGAHYLQSYAFANGTNHSAIVFNLSRSSSQTVTFSGVNAPSGSVQMQQLTSANPTDTNETASVVNIAASSLPNFNGASGLTLPPYSMTVLTWTGQGSSQGTAPVISAVTASVITSASATITWTTDQASTSQVNYGTSTSYGSASPLNSALVTSHSVNLTGLTPGTAYDFDVVSATSAGLSSASGNATFTTAPKAPTISAISASGITASTVTITWTTDQASTSLVNYGTTTSYGSTSAYNSTLVTSHSVTLTGLAAGTTYDFDVLSANAAGVLATSANTTFTTSASTGGSAPTVSYVAYWGITGSGVTISWSTNVAATTAVLYGTTSALGQTTAVQTSLVTSHGVTLTGLNPLTTYYFEAESTGANGVTGYSTLYSFTTISSGMPTISGITVVPGANNTAQISWTTSVPTTSYVQFGSTTAYNHWSSLTALTTNPNPAMGWVPSGTVHYSLVSTDANGNQTISPDYTFQEP